MTLAGRVGHGAAGDDHTPERRGSQVAGFGLLLHAEWTKFRTVRGWVIATVISALLTTAIGIWAASGVHGEPCGTMLPNGQIMGMACPAPPLGPGGEMVTDNFYLVRQPLRGNGSISVRVTALAGASPQNAGSPGAVQSWAKAGIIVKAGLRQGSAYAAMMVTGGHGVRMQYDYTQDIAGLPGAVSAAAPRWLRLIRSGDTLTGYDSADGAHWTLVGAARLAGLPRVVQAGLFVASPDAVAAESTSATLASAVFDHAAVSGARPGTAWSGDDVGANAPHAPLPGGFRQAGGTFTVSGSGDIAPAVANSAGSGRAADQGIIGAFAGLIVAIVVGTTFMTAEYRRGLIRTTLIAAQRRGHVLAAKAAVIGSVTFAAGLAGAAAAVVAGAILLRRSGFYVFPVGGLTQVRVVAGTAALLAVAAVLALAVGTIMRQGPGPVAAVIALIVVPYFFSGPLPVVPAGVASWLLRITPAAAFAVQQSLPAYPQVSSAYTAQYGYYPLAPLAGLGVLCAWAALALCLAAYLLRHRDA